MEFRHLRYFVVLSEELHFGRAAARLHMAQPPLSQRIRDLERELGVRLLDRDRHRVRLTEAGALLLEYARPVLDSADAAREAMRRIRPGAAGVLRVGVPPDTVPVTLRTLVDAFSAREPGVLLDLNEMTTDEQLAQLREGGLDVGMVRHPTDTVGLESGPVVHRPLGVVLPVEHPAAEDATVRLRRLNGSPLVIFPRLMAPKLYDHMLTACRDNGFVPGAIRHARNPHFVHGLVLAGRGVHLNEEPSAGLPPGLVWRPVDEQSGRLTWSTSVVWPRAQTTPVVAAFAECALSGLRAAGHVPRD
ncbi:LysR substrate-binding domain-containing protein [Streptomyces iconiensis]|uniref:LysR substrate-binding domain-containing protein n=1 Tax=Streptomyces iconiensis TaxID=1384038 RepID=A0ABT6ZZ66_9ACTN|nr:LysR substrate-binding domain-containing protein [Streptomyces iconiensis]MDJ1134361.1 LysR substrate-binding domain-containing protein [Streptomyces iconiensis]